MKSDLLTLVLLDDCVRKITYPCPFCTRKYEKMSGIFGLCIWGKGLKSQKRPPRKVFVYKIQVNPIHTILKYGDYYDFQFGRV